MMLAEPRYVRPPEGLARGLWDVPRWVIGVVGAAVVLVALTHLLWRARRALRGKR